MPVEGRSSLVADPAQLPVCATVVHCAASRHMITCIFQDDALQALSPLDTVTDAVTARPHDGRNARRGINTRSFEEKVLANSSKP